MKVGRPKSLGLLIGVNFFILVAVIIGFLYPVDLPGVPVFDTPLEEFVAFFWLGMMLVAVFAPGPLQVVLLLVAVSAVAGLYELVEAWTPFREDRMLDWAGNVVSVTMGAAVGLGLARLIAQMLPDHGE